MKAEGSESHWFFLMKHSNTQQGTPTTDAAFYLPAGVPLHPSSSDDGNSFPKTNGSDVANHTLALLESSPSLAMSGEQAAAQLRWVQTGKDGL